MTTSNGNEIFKSRGLGTEFGLKCFVTGEKSDGPNIAAFVESKEAGERIVKMFNGRAKLSYREREPDWIQVKVGVTNKYKIALEKLNYLVSDENIINKEMVEDAKNVIFDNAL